MKNRIVKELPLAAKHKLCDVILNALRRIININDYRATLVTPYSVSNDVYKIIDSFVNIEMQNVSDTSDIRFKKINYETVFPEFYMCAKEYGTSIEILENIFFKIKKMLNDVYDVELTESEKMEMSYNILVGIRHALKYKKNEFIFMSGKYTNIYDAIKTYTRIHFNNYNEINLKKVFPELYKCKDKKIGDSDNWFPTLISLQYHLENIYDNIYIPKIIEFYTEIVWSLERQTTDLLTTTYDTSHSLSRHYSRFAILEELTPIVYDGTDLTFRLENREDNIEIFKQFIEKNVLYITPKNNWTLI